MSDFNRYMYYQKTLFELFALYNFTNYKTKKLFQKYFLKFQNIFTFLNFLKKVSLCIRL